MAPVRLRTSKAAGHVTEQGRNAKDIFTHLSSPRLLLAVHNQAPDVSVLAVLLCLVIGPSECVWLELMRQAQPTDEPRKYYQMWKP